MSKCSPPELSLTQKDPRNLATASVISSATNSLPVLAACEFKWTNSSLEGGVEVDPIRFLRCKCILLGCPAQSDLPRWMRRVGCKCPSNHAGVNNSGELQSLLYVLCSQGLKRPTPPRYVQLGWSLDEGLLFSWIRE